jgi:glycosyltransferase involved in cell wall biosynthesis
MPLWKNARWGLAVMGPSEPGYVHSVVELAETLGVSQRFAILPLVPYDKLPLYTPGAHVGHALYEPIHINHLYPTTASNKLLEYMAAGLPVIVSDRPGLRAFVDKYKCGLLADEISPESIAAAVNALLDDPELAHRLGGAGVRAFEEELNYERQFAPVLEAFRSLCGDWG